jgi:hypothetical protein
MILQSISLELDRWGKHEGRYTGRARFSNDCGNVEVILAPDTSDKILALLADQLVAAAQETAKLMTAQIISTAAHKLENLSHESNDPF